MNTKKRLSSITAAALGLTVLVAGCGSAGTSSNTSSQNSGSNSGSSASANASSSSNQSSSQSSATPQTFTVWDIQTGPLQTTIKNATDTFNKSQSKYVAKLQFYSNDNYKQKIQIAMGANNPPDLIFGWGGGVLKTYIDANKVVNLDSFLQANPQYKNKFFPGVWANVTFNGHIYGVPEAAGTQPELLFYNKAIFKKYNLPVPQTWAQLMSDVKTLKSHGVAPIAIGARDKWPDLMWLMYLSDRIGGPSVFHNIITKKPNAWSDPAILKSLQMIQQLINAGGFEKGYNGVSADSNEDQALLYSGKAAMLLQGVWVYPTIKSSAANFTKTDLGWTTFPTVSGGTGNPADVMGNPTNYYYIYSGSKSKQAAEDYLKTVPFNQYEIQQDLKNGVVPPIKGLSNDFANVPNSAFLKYVYTTAEKAPVLVTGWDQLLPPSEAQVLLNDLNSLFAKKMTPAQFVTSMNQALAKS